MYLIYRHTSCERMRHPALNEANRKCFWYRMRNGFVNLGLPYMKLIDD